MRGSKQSRQWLTCINPYTNYWSIFKVSFICQLWKIPQAVVDIGLKIWKPCLSVANVELQIGMVSTVNSTYACIIHVFLHDCTPHATIPAEGKCGSNPRHHGEATARQLGMTFACLDACMWLIIQKKYHSLLIIKAAKTYSRASTNIEVQTEIKARTYPMTIWYLSYCHK